VYVSAGLSSREAWHTKNPPKLQTRTIGRETTTKNMAENPATARFREYVRIDSSHPDPDYPACVR
jgi:hypothetical protein